MKRIFIELSPVEGAAIHAPVTIEHDRVVVVVTDEVADHIWDDIVRSIQPLASQRFASRGR